ncbi:hypothetical protein [Rhodococcus xishaensis]|uniref:Uncharacterized protein n=1 Tax=Rhodococcus xishaensis TaxID=2487364 RepID=A0A438B2L9_9NOCA|nr:hypothetical protein [Rhodococcus xishaensis]RVW05128.1 hypothetical protein EGT50_00330 [Rhodococcus xishaensis]
MTELDESTSRPGAQRSDRDTAAVDFWSDERTELARLFVGHVVLWTSVLIAFLFSTRSSVDLEWPGLYAQFLLIPVALAFAVSVAARSRVRAGIGAVLALSVLVINPLVGGIRYVFVGEDGNYESLAILIAAVAGVTAATAGWLVARRTRRACLRVLPLAAVLTLAMYLLIESIRSGAFGYSNGLGQATFVIPAVITAWIAVAYDRRFGEAAAAAEPPGPPTRA